MAIKRTRKQKQRSEQRREETLKYSFKDLGAPTAQDASDRSDMPRLRSREKINTIPLFNAEYIKKDLLKTVITTIVVVAVLIAYTTYYRYR